MPPAVQRAAKEREQRNAREVVVGERRVADMGRQQHLVVRLARGEALAVAERAVLEGRVDRTW